MVWEGLQIDRALSIIVALHLSAIYQIAGSTVDWLSCRESRQDS
jgi:hypothetical protein